MSILEALETGLGLLKQGEIDAARRCFNQVLEMEAEQPDALHLIGICEGQLGRFSEAESWLNRAIASLPDNPGFRTSLAEIFMQSGQMDAALQAFEQALDCQPDHVPAIFGLGLTHQEMQSHGNAKKAYQLALTIQPDLFPALNNLGSILESEHDLEGAKEAYQEATRRAPEYGRAWFNLARMNEVLGDFSEARQNYLRVTRLDPGHADAWFGLAVCLHRCGDRIEAMEAWLKVLELRPGHAPSLANFSGLLREMGHYDHAERAARQSLDGDAGSATAWSNLGATLHCLGRFSQAEEAFRTALTHNPDHVEAHVSLGQTLLQTERFDEGWSHYDWRLKNHLQWMGSASPAPLWQGQDLSEESLLIYAEQGYGDSFQFLRFLPLLRQMTGKLYLRVPNVMMRLLHGQVDCDGLFAGDDALPDHDFRLPIMSIPAQLGLGKSALSMAAPYIHAPAVPPLARTDSNLRIGLVWAGNPAQANDRNRSTSLDWFDRLVNVPGATFVSLQKGDVADEVLTRGMAERLLPIGQTFRDFADTAAVIDNMDLVITVDTSIAHLAGAMGKKTWVMLCHVPDWRWGVYGEDCYWYPSVTLFRQNRPGDWAGVTAMVEDRLRDYIAQQDRGAAES